MQDIDTKIAVIKCIDSKIRVRVCLDRYFQLFEDERHLVMANSDNTWM